MNRLIRWLAADEIAQAQPKGYRDGMLSAAAAIRRVAHKDSRPAARDVLQSVADGIADALDETDAA